nr:abortive infection system antitoxin AbiGi family protein [uncultured Draconibacterium sp.]
MRQEVLYHFFPRKSDDIDNAFLQLKSIINNGLFLTKEIIDVPWKDYYRKSRERKLAISQYRFCLTAISNREELISHSKEFGFIGIEFNIDFITQLGGFPVFYVPSPLLESKTKEDYKGISLLYRIAETQEILEFILKNKILYSNDIDIENVLGAIRLLANICYPTHPKPDSKMCKSNYYNQREWRIIYGLTPENVIVYKKEDFYVINSFYNKPFSHFIKKIIICKHKEIDDYIIKKLYEKVESFLHTFSNLITIEIIT